MQGALNAGGFNESPLVYTAVVILCRPCVGLLFNLNTTRSRAMYCATIHQVCVFNISNQLNFASNVWFTGIMGSPLSKDEKATGSAIEFPGGNTLNMLRSKRRVL